jgi:hypothetical protein
MTAPLHRRTEKIGACLADPFANGEGAKEIDTFTIPDGGRRREYQPYRLLRARPAVLSIKKMSGSSRLWIAPHSVNWPSMRPYALPIREQEANDCDRYYNLSMYKNLTDCVEIGFQDFLREKDFVKADNVEIEFPFNQEI